MNKKDLAVTILFIIMWPMFISEIGLNLLLKTMENAELVTGTSALSIIFFVPITYALMMAPAFIIVIISVIWEICLLALIIDGDTMIRGHRFLN